MQKETKMCMNEAEETEYNLNVIVNKQVVPTVSCKVNFHNG